MTETKVTIPSMIDDNEPLLRAISKPSCLDKENRVTHLAFRLRHEEDSLSLSRLLYEDLKSFLKRAFRLKFRFLTPEDVTAGAVELHAREVKNLDEHIILHASPNRRNPAHASIIFKNQDGTDYVGVNTTDPVDSSILGYEMALASIVQKVYDREGNVIWRVETNQKEKDTDE